MKKIFLAKLLAGFSGAALLTYGVMLACGGYDDFDYRYQTNFTPEIFVPTNDLPFMLSGNLFYSSSEIPEIETFSEIMVKDWSAYLGKVADEDVVRYFLLDSSHAVVNAMYTNKGVPKIKGNFERSSEKGKAFIKFLYLAKQVESASVYQNNWSYEPNYKTFDDSKTVGEIESIYKSTQDKFLKKRYWFQTLKAYFYSSNKKRVIPFFNATQSTVEKDLLYYRGLAYVAGAHYRVKEYAQANYLFSLVFTNCPQLRQMAVFNFHPQEQSDWNQTLKLAKSNEEKAAVWAMHGYYGDEAEAIENIFKLNPKSKDLEFLLARLVNKIETNSSFSAEQPWTHGTVHAAKPESAIDMVSKIAESGNTTKPEIWHLAAGYLQTIGGNYAKSKSHYDKASGKLTTERQKKQLRLVRVVDAVAKLDVIDVAAENRLLPELEWLLLDAQKDSADADFRLENAQRWARNAMSVLYQKAEKPVLAEMYVRKSGFFRNPDHMRAMRAFLEKSTFTPYEKMVGKLYDVKLDDIYHFEAVTATLDNKIPEAITLMKKASGQKDAKFLGDPFLGNIQDCHDCDHYAKKAREYSEIQFLEELQKRQDKIRNIDDVYTNSVLLGNAFYNLTHFGNGRSFYQDDIFNFESYSYYDRNTEAMQDVYNCTIAAKYYRQALQYAKTDEQKAKCHYLLAKCERNDYYNETFGLGGTAWYHDNKTHFLAWDNFKALKQYSKTNYYRDVIRECGYFRKYVSKR